MACNHIWLQSQCRALPQVQIRLCWCQAQGWGERQHQKKMKAILFCAITSPPWAVRRQSWLLLINSLEICGRGVQERSPSRGQGGVPPEKPWGGPWSGTFGVTALALAAFPRCCSWFCSRTFGMSPGSSQKCSRSKALLQEQERGAQQ